MFIIPENKQGAGRSLLSGIAQGIPGGLQSSLKELLERKKNQRLLEQIFPGKKSNEIIEPDEQRILSGNELLKSETQKEPQNTTRQRIALTMTGGKTGSDVANILGEQEKSQRKEKIEERKYAQEETKPLKESIRNLRESIPQNENSLKLIEDAIEGSGSWEGYADFLANTTGIENFRTRKGAALRSGIKQYFLSDLGKIPGGRANMLIENNLLDAYQKMGRDPIANLQVLEGQKTKLKLEKEKERLYSELEEKYLEKGFHLPANAEYQINKQLRPIGEKIRNDLSKNLEKLNRISTDSYKKARTHLRKGESLMLGENGDLQAVEREEIPDFEEKGYIKI